MTRLDRPGGLLIALGAALGASCGGGGDTPTAANLPPTVTLAAPSSVIQSPSDTTVPFTLNWRFSAST